MDLTTAFQQLAQLTPGAYTPNDLFAIAKQLGVNAEGSVTVLYSGSVNGVSSSAIAESMTNDPSIRIINKTDVAEFLNSTAFKIALGETQGISPRRADSLAVRRMKTMHQ